MIGTGSYLFMREAAYAVGIAQRTGRLCLKYNKQSVCQVDLTPSPR